MTKDYKILISIRTTNTTIINKGEIKLPTKSKEPDKYMSSKGSKDMGKQEINQNPNDPLHIASYNPKGRLGSLYYNLISNESSVPYKPTKVSYVKSDQDLIGTFAIDQKTFLKSQSIESLLGIQSIGHKPMTTMQTLHFDYLRILVITKDPRQIQVRDLKSTILHEGKHKPILN